MNSVAEEQYLDECLDNYLWEEVKHIKGDTEHSKWVLTSYARRHGGEPLIPNYEQLALGGRFYTQFNAYQDRNGLVFYNGDWRTKQWWSWFVCSNR